MFILGVDYVQYAHARIAVIVRKASEAGLAPAASVGGYLDAGPEAALALVTVAGDAEVVEDAVLGEETVGITAYASELATAFHASHRDARVVDDAEPARLAARLALVQEAQTTLARALALLANLRAGLDVARDPGTWSA